MDRLTPRDRFILTRAVPLVVSVLFVVVVGLAVLVQRNSRNVEDLTDATTHVQSSTHRVEDFVDELETETPEEAAQNAAVTAAVQLVPQIKDILCQAFPEATACQG